MLNTTQKLQELKDNTKPRSGNKNGYEIRAQVLELAQQHVWQHYNAILNKTSDMTPGDTTPPGIPSIDRVLLTAEKFYEFVNKK
jgi:hypothetical protein